ncbi:MAG: carboxypeptidase regulatory-like domain-containing protein [Putridiphycobacter sp.]
MRNLVLLIFLGLGAALNAQVGLGMIRGEVFNYDSTANVPFANLKIEVDGSVVGVKSDINGKFKFLDVKPGVYNITVTAASNGETVLKGVTVKPDQILDIDVYMGAIIGTTVVVNVDKPKLDINNVSTITSEELKNNPNIRSPKDMVVSKLSDVSMDQNNQMIIRGSRPGDVIYYLDGVKMTDMKSVPGASVRGMTVYTGGIPAKYGDTMGGVVILETKSYFDLYYAWKASMEK